VGGSTATIEYAVSLLGVKHVIVCGHTDCAVMKAILHPETVEGLPAVKSWVAQAETTRRIIRENDFDLKGDELLVTMNQENFRVQLDHVRTHPGVAARLRRGTLDIHGWVYYIPTGDIWTLDDGKETFVSSAAR